MKRLIPLLICLLASPIFAAPGFWTHSAKVPMDKAYSAVHDALQAENFWVVYEANLGQFMAKNKQRWGDDYNRNGLDAVRSMVFCNIWWTNQFANADPDMVGLCPLSLSLYEKDGVTTVTFARPTVLATGIKGDAGMTTARKLEDELAGILGKALDGVAE